MLECGRLQGIKISDKLTICYCLFADDMGLFIPAMEEAFRNARDAITTFELASSAKLNLGKSVVIPFGVTNIPLWLLNVWCKISTPGMVQRYLGAPWGVGISKTCLFDFCLKSISRRLNSWSTQRYLSRA